MKRITLAALALFGSSIALAETATEKLSMLIGSLNSFSAKYEQTVQGSRNAKGEKSHGTFQLQRPGKFRWETETPFRQILVSTGKEMWAYEPDIESATVQDLEQGLGATPALLLSSTPKQLIDSFVIEETGVGMFKLLPKDSSGNFEEIQLVFENKQLTQLRLADTLGNQTLVVFSSIKLNQPLAASSFEFVPGAQVDVIDNRKKQP
ncbi:outer membrane lipoprotein chaperone LolA [Permianibacter sp. IMCC34836]|uniref:outer membrane lipoprotein chaperone LolA n=1 Tax=Permianibacter fluminis TaxID=2738515 RepID=UPI001555546C|nr:outer membrane lipoprotein chaperone LolA [Permianibacter fluminis]NQD37835.1 outer membrane lipoprotein chaperone LolA [Permianibacter fluminis]